MISVRIKNDLIEIKGHANQNEFGTDIVCASVSTAVIMSINLIDSFNLLKNIDYKIEDGYTLINIITNDDNLNKIINNLIYTLKDLEKSYKKYITIK